jgi:hypothetical protein
MIVRSEEAVAVLGPARKPDPIRKADSLETFPIGSRVTYERNRSGSVVDVSECGRWALIERDHVFETERGRVAVLLGELKK